MKGRMKTIKTCFVAALVAVGLNFVAQATVMRAELSLASLSEDARLKPIAVKLAPNSPVGFSYADCTPDHMAFIGADGEELPFEVATWNTSGESVIWVRPLTTDDTITLTYGAEVTPTKAATEVWAEYSGVWHFDQFDTSDTTTRSQASSPNSTAEEGIDAHIANTTGTKINQEGFFGTGVQTADTGSDAGLWMKDAGAKSPLDGGAQFTISGWFKHKAENYSWDHIFYKRSKSDNSGGDYTGAFAIEVGDNKDTFPVNPRGSGTKSGAKTPSVNPKGTWVQLTFVYDNTTCRFYENGALVDNIAIDACVDNDAPLAVGNNSNYEINGGIDSPWKGWVDEVRFSKGVKSADWVAAEYECAAGDILSMGEVQTIVSEDLVTVTITADDSKETYTATANDEPVTSGDAVSSNAMVTVVATPKTGYLYFPVPEGWTKGTEEKTITAKFRAGNDPTMIEIPDPTVIADVRVKVTVEPSQHGTITGAEDEYEYGAQATLTAVPDDVFVFAGWTGAAEGETANPLTLTMDDNKTIGAIFKPIDLIKNGSFEEGIGDSIPVGGVKNPPSSLPTGMTGGSDILAVRGKGDRSGDGSVIPASIKIYDGYYTVGFARNGWYSMNVEVARPGLYELTVHKIARLGYTGGTVDVYCDDDKCTTISAAGTSAWETETKTFKLSMGTHALKFQHVSSGGQTLLDDLSLCLVEEDPKHTVNFANTESQTYTATVLGNEVKDGDQVYENSIVTVTATPAVGYGYGTAPEGWTESGASITKDFTIVADTAITIPKAQPLADVKYTLTFAPCTWGSIAGKSGEFSAGETTELTAIPEDDGFCFAGWTGAAEGETANPLTVTMDGNKTIGAIFKPVNLIKNGSFEDCEDDIGPREFKDDGNFTRPTGWDGGRVLIRSDANGWMGNDNPYVTGAVQLPDGQFCVGFKRAGSLSTSVTVKKSGRYTLTIQKIRRKNDTWGGSLIEVCFDDATIGTISVPSNSKWEEQSFEVRLGPGEHTLKFNNPNTYDESIFLDDISFVLQEELPAEVVVDTEHVSQSFGYQNVGVERTINVKVEMPNAGYTIKYSTTEEGEYTTDPIKYWQAGEYTIYYRVEAEGMEPAAGFGTVTIGENWMPNGSFEDGTWIQNNSYGILNNAKAGTEVWVNTKDSGKENGDICRARSNSPFLGNVPAADGSYAYIATLNNQIGAPINLARSGKYQFSCKYMCRVNYNYYHDQTAVVKIDGVAVATVPSTEEKTKWRDFSSEKFQLSKGEHTITIEGTTSQDSTILLDALRLDFKGGSGLLIMLN